MLFGRRHHESTPKALACRKNKDGSRCVFMKCPSSATVAAQDPKEPFLRLLSTVKGLCENDQKNYAKLFVQEKIRGLDQLAKFDAGMLKSIGIPIGDAIEIVEAMQRYSTSQLLEKHQHNSTSSLMSDASISTDEEETISILPSLPAGIEYYGFASHNWGNAESGFLNHTRTIKLIEKMKGLDIPVWFDHNRMSGAIESQITTGIDASATFLVFVTKEYIEKVMTGSDSATTDWCHYEFVYAGLQKPNKMIAIVMEPDMLDTRKWKGAVGARLGTKVFVDFTSDDKLDSAAVDLCRLMSTMV